MLGAPVFYFRRLIQSLYLVPASFSLFFALLFFAVFFFAGAFTGFEVGLASPRGILITLLVFPYDIDNTLIVVLVSFNYELVNDIPISKSGTT
tara:strand:- start:2391 stop:2669 length:279 start_codon:yes stop_codon:yes gene_type:complete